MANKLNKKMKFASKSSMAFRELKKAGHLVKSVMAENRQLKKENDVLIKTITALQESSKPVEDLQPPVYVDGEERTVHLLDLQSEAEETELSFPEEEATHSHFFNAYEDLMHNNNKTEQSVYNDEYQSICDGLLALIDAEELVNNQGSGDGTEIVAAAAAMLSFCS